MLNYILPTGIVSDSLSLENIVKTSKMLPKKDIPAHWVYKKFALLQPMLVQYEVVLKISNYFLIYLQVSGCTKLSFIANKLLMS